MAPHFKPRYLLKCMSIILLFRMMFSPGFCHESLVLVVGHERCLYQRTLRWELAWRCPALIFSLRPTAPQNKTKMRTILFKRSFSHCVQPPPKTRQKCNFIQAESAKWCRIFEREATAVVSLYSLFTYSLDPQKWILKNPVSLQECRQTIVFSGWWKGNSLRVFCVKGRVTPVHSCQQRASSDTVIIRCT